MNKDPFKEYKDFCEELKKQKAKITAMQKMELLSLYEETQSYITKDTMRIEGLQAQLDREIFSLYGISEKIIELISSEITIKL